MSRIHVVGAGIVGSAVATWLTEAGHEVVVFDADPDGLPTSSGNAALIALPEIAPLASPGILTAVPGWLLDPLGPLTIRWQDVPAMLPWLMAFLRSAVPSHGVHVRRALGSLMQTALDDHRTMSGIAGVENYLRQSGYLSVHSTQRSVAAGLDEAEKVKAVLGYDYEALDVAAARRLVPQLEGDFAGAVHQPGYWMVTNPLTVLRHYQSFLRGKARIEAGRVVGLEQGADGVTLNLEDGRSSSADFVVVAAGVWSRELVRQSGAKVLLETERGYNTTFTDLDWNLAMPVGFADHGFIASPLVDGLRVGGAVELAKPETAPNYGRAKAMRAKMRRYVPALPEGGTEWMGRRPSTPDSLPVISRHPRDKRVLFAFGHGHLGLTLSAVTGRMIADLVAGGPEVPAFSIQRFQ
ncbi:MAG: FAD-dependent oxidoreductase [Candidatus Devosia phytovorans]|uniref:FAD-dependent oxidoreductase n=1 Tax=Candidatus Devosia phytovorans TaxID=3121372 RepID=A0AAJ5VWX8_9HYPH|nr:FAD-dependent oxidoreductase [Devosia sp.]WEK04997.1 MAG: FAD-dependent oxidoreductase [Devosia sp.]